MACVGCAPTSPGSKTNLDSALLRLFEALVCMYEECPPCKSAVTKPLSISSEALPEGRLDNRRHREQIAPSTERT